MTYPEAGAGVAFGALVGALVTVGVSTVAEPVPPYDRAAFGAAWLDADGDCQNTRAEVLLRDARGPVSFRSDRACVVDAGLWLDVYSGREIRTARELDVDHLVPLRAAWAAGAWAWSPARRRAYANSLAAGHLVATHRSINRSKGARGPAAWLPPVARVEGTASSLAACQYAEQWFAVKQAWGLSLEPVEVEALRRAWSGCDG
jgi:hypothetical protein